MDTGLFYSSKSLDQRPTVPIYFKEEENGTEGLKAEAAL